MTGTHRRQAAGFSRFASRRTDSTKVWRVFHTECKQTYRRELRHTYREKEGYTRARTHNGQTKEHTGSNKTDEVSRQADKEDAKNNDIGINDGFPGWICSDSNFTGPHKINANDLLERDVPTLCAHSLTVLLRVVVVRSAGWKSVFPPVPLPPPLPVPFFFLRHISTCAGQPNRSRDQVMAW